MPNEPAPTDPRTEPRARRAVAFAFVLGAVPLCLLAARFWFVCDDAFISFRYVEHLVAGHGPVWNVGDPPVEGYSHPLWVLWLAAWRLVGVAPTVAAPWTGLLCGLLLLGVVVRSVAARVGTGVPLFGAALLLGTSPIVATWCTGGLETMAAALVATLLPLAWWRARAGTPANGWQLGALAAALAWLRPEGVVVAAGFLALFAADWLRRGRPREPGRALATALAVLVLAVAALTAFRLVYFGDWLPNTARAKGGLHAFRLVRGTRYLLGVVLTFPGIAVAAAAGLLLGRLRHRLPGLGVATVLFGAGLAAWTVLVGGDFMTMGRFVVPVLPFVATWFACALATLRERGHAAAAALLAGAVAAANLPPAFDHHLTPASWREHAHYGRPSGQPATEYRAWVQQHDGPLADAVLARALREHTTPGESLLRGAIGTVGYHTRLRVLDVFALTARRPAADHVLVPANQAGHDRVLPWPVWLDEHPTYADAQLGTPGGDVVSGLLQGPFAISPLRDLVEVLRFPVPEPDAAGGAQELRLLAFRRWDLPTDRLPALLACVQGLDPADPASAAELARRADAAGAALAGDDAALRELLAAGRIAHHGAAPLRFSFAAESSPRTAGFAVWVTVQSAANAYHRVPRGKFVHALALDGAPTIEGRPPGWHVVAPAASHADTVAGGTALLVHFLPAGALF